LALGSTVAELQERMSSTEFSEWIAFYRLEPFGARRNDWGHAIVASVVYNMLKAKGSKDLTAEDFLPEFNEQDITAREAREVQRLADKMSGVFGSL
jgi:hypothetical protein